MIATYVSVPTWYVLVYKKKKKKKKKLSTVQNDFRGISSSY